VGEVETQILEPKKTVGKRVFSKEEVVGKRVRGKEFETHPRQESGFSKRHMGEPVTKESQDGC